MYADSFDQKEERTENKPIGEISINPELCISFPKP